MANIVRLREMSDQKLEEMLENAREEMFNLRFQKATAQLDNTARMRTVRREIAQLETVLRMRQMAADVAATQPEIAAVLINQDWQANTRFVYEDSAWQVQFTDRAGNELASALVDLNKKRQDGRKGRAAAKQPRLVKSYEVTG